MIDWVGRISNESWHTLCTDVSLACHVSCATQSHMSHDALSRMGRYMTWCSQDLIFNFCKICFADFLSARERSWRIYIYVYIYIFKYIYICIYIYIRMSHDTQSKVSWLACHGSCVSRVMCHVCVVSSFIWHACISTHEIQSVGVMSYGMRVSLFIWHACISACVYLDTHDTCRLHVCRCHVWRVTCHVCLVSCV